jgi:hypothetical protein
MTHVGSGFTPTTRLRSGVAGGIHPLGSPVKPATLITLIITCALIVLAIIRVAPVVGLKDSARERYPYTSGGR